MQKEITTVLCSLTPIEPDRPGQVGPNQIGMRKVSPAQVDGSQVSLEQVGPAQVRARELRSGEVGPHQFWPRDGELPPRPTRTLDAYARGLDDFLGFCQKANISPVTATRADLARNVGDLRERQDGRHSPSEVLRGVLGRTYAEEVLSRVLHATQFTRHLDRHGYIRFKHWRLFGENGLAGEGVSVWVYEETLKIEYRATTLALYSLTFQIVPLARQLLLPEFGATG